MNEERTGFWLRQTEHICDYLRHRYSVAVKQVMVATVKLSKVMTSTLPLWTLASVAYLLAETLYHGNHDMNHSICNIGSTERYILHMQLEWSYIKLMKIYIGKSKLIFCRRINFDVYFNVGSKMLPCILQENYFLNLAINKDMADVKLLLKPSEW